MTPDEIKAWIDRCSQLAAAGNWDAYLDAHDEVATDDYVRWHHTNKARLAAAELEEECPSSPA